MMKLLDKAIEIVRKLSLEHQDEIARVMLAFAADSELEIIDPAHLPAVLEGLGQVRSGSYSSAADVEAAFRRFDR